MTTAYDEPTSAQDKNIEKLYVLKSQFNDGLELSRDHILILVCMEMANREEKRDSFSHDDLAFFITSLSDTLRLGLDKSKTETLIQKLIRLKVVKNTISVKIRYRLSRLGRNLVKSILEEADYRPEAFNSLLFTMFSAIKESRNAGVEDLKRTLRFTVFEVIQEKIEAKIARIDEDLESRKQQARDAYTDSENIGYDRTVANLKHCQNMLNELVKAIDRSSALGDLELELEDCEMTYDDPDLYKMIGQSQDFLHDFRNRIQTMLTEFVNFVRLCTARHSLALSVTARERLWRAQRKILVYALDHPCCMPHLPVPQIPRWKLPERQSKRTSPVVFAEEQVEAVKQVFAGKIPNIEQQWKKRLVQTARQTWEKHAARGGVDLLEWIDELVMEVPETLQHIEAALFFLMKEWSKWKPGIVAQTADEQWVAWKGGRHIKSIFLKSAGQNQEQTALLAKAI